MVQLHEFIHNVSGAAQRKQNVCVDQSRDAGPGSLPWQCRMTRLALWNGDQVVEDLVQGSRDWPVQTHCNCWGNEMIVTALHLVADDTTVQVDSGMV